VDAPYPMVCQVFIPHRLESEPESNSRTGVNRYSQRCARRASPIVGARHLEDMECEKGAAGEAPAERPDRLPHPNVDTVYFVAWVRHGLRSPERPP
jgi:hypothetical protein